MQDERAKLFADVNVRCTRQRLDVYTALCATKAHPTAEQLHRMVLERSPGTSLATVYNTLELLCQAGLCRRIPTGEGCARYDADTSAHVHVLTRAGQVMDAPEDLGRAVLAALPAELIDALESRLGGQLAHLSIALAQARPSPAPTPAPTA